MLVPTPSADETIGVKIRAPRKAGQFTFKQWNSGNAGQPGRTVLVEQSFRRNRLIEKNRVPEGTHPASTPGRRDGLPRSGQAATAALDCWFAFQFQGSRSATLLAG